MIDERGAGAEARPPESEDARPPDWTAADEALWRLAHEIAAAREEGAALLARWEAGEDLAHDIQRELFRAAFAAYRVGRELADELA